MCDVPLIEGLSATLAETQASHHSLFNRLAALANDVAKDRITAADLVVAFEDRAAIALILIFASPNMIPMPPGTSAVLGVPLLLFSAQAALGRKPWLPRAIAQCSISRAVFASLLLRARPWFVKTGGMLKPRLARLQGRALMGVIGSLCFVLSMIIFLPIPLGNMAPSYAIAMLALGAIERDGVWILCGIVMSLASIALAGGVTLVLAKVAASMLMHVFS